MLFIGSNFTNWLARLFLRMAKRQRLSDPPLRAALLKEAAALLDAAPPQLKSIRIIRQWRERVSQAQHG